MITNGSAASRTAPKIEVSHGPRKGLRHAVARPRPGGLRRSTARQRPAGNPYLISSSRSDGESTSDTSAGGIALADIGGQAATTQVAHPDLLRLRIERRYATRH